MISLRRRRYGEEIDDAILLKKDREGNVIGVEIISMEAIAKKGVEIPL